jgi:hypothetical protein
MSPLTFVTAFVGGINARADRDIHEYVRLGFALLSAGAPTVAFIDRETHARFFAAREREFPHTRFVVIDRADIYLMHYKCDATAFAPITDDPAKDTFEYIAVQCNKTEWIREAVEMDCFGSEQFAWLDFGVARFFEGEPGALRRALTHMESRTYTDVRMPHTQTPDFEGFSDDILRHIVWMFPGSVFGGHRLALLAFARRVKAKCLQLLDAHKLVVWEINVFKLVFFENIALFDLYAVETHDAQLCLRY